MGSFKDSCISLLETRLLLSFDFYTFAKVPIYDTGIRPVMVVVVFFFLTLHPDMPVRDIAA